MLRKMVHESKIDANTSHEINIENASSGIYKLKVYYGNKIINRKIVIQYQGFVIENQLFTERNLA